MASENTEPRKRRSKWDVTSAKEVNTTTNTPTGAAAVAAAKLNAMLAAKGKLVKADNVILPPTPTPSLGTSMPSSHTPTPASKITLLTPPPNVAPLYSSSEPLPSGHLYIQDKVFVGLEQASATFNLADKLKGPDNSYLAHISTQTAGKVFLRGRGSGFIEPTSGKESFEALHIYISHSTRDGLNNARKLCQSLINTVKKDYDNFKSPQSAPLGFEKSPGYANNQVRPNVNPYALHPANPPGYGPGYGHPPPPSHGYGPPPPGPPPSYGYYPPGPPGPPAPGYGPPHGYYGPPPPSHTYPPPHMNPPQPEMRTGPPNAFVDYRTYDKAPVQTTDAVKRKFSEEQTNQSAREPSEDKAPPTAKDTSPPPTAGSKRKFIEDVVSSNKRRFTEGASAITETANPSMEDKPKEEPAPLVGKWQNLSQSTTVAQKSVVLPKKSSMDDKLTPDKEKGLMPPPSLPGGLGRSKGMNFRKPEASPQKGGATNIQSDKPVVGLSLVAHYGEDSDSDTDT